MSSTYEARGHQVAASPARFLGPEDAAIFETSVVCSSSGEEQEMSPPSASSGSEVLNVRAMKVSLGSQIMPEARSFPGMHVADQETYK